MSKNNYYEHILKSFDIIKYNEGKEFLENSKNANHTEIKKMCKKYGFVNVFDYVRSCNEANFTDFYIRPVEKVLKDNSKYVVSRRLEHHSPPIYLCNNNLQSVFSELKERFFDRGYYERDKKRIKGYFVDDNILKFGTKESGYYIVEFERGNINSLVKQNYYSIQKEHLNFQAQLSALGVYFNYGSKLARQEKNQLAYDINLNKLATLNVPDLEINNIREDKELEEIDFIDVIWLDKNAGKVIAAFEVEFSGNWKQALGRFTSLKLACRDYGDEINFVILTDGKNYRNIANIVKMERYQRDFQTGKLKFLSIKDFIRILYTRDCLLSPSELKRDFFNNALIDINRTSIQH